MSNIDPEAFGEAIGEMIREVHDTLSARIDTMQARVEKAMTYTGEFQTPLDYPAGSLVRRGEHLYVASKAIGAGGQPPNREGSGWQMIA